MLRFMPIIILVIPLTAFGLDNNQKNFYIIFGSGFKNDTLLITINNNVIIDKAVLQSDSILGGTNASIQFLNDSLMFRKNSKILNKIPFKYENKLIIIFTINSHPYHLLADLKRGKYILISKHRYYYNVYLSQYKKPIVFE